MRPIPFGAFRLGAQCGSHPISRKKVMRETRLAVWLTVLMTMAAVMFSSATTTADEVAIRKIIQEEVAAWNSGDATVYSSEGNGITSQSRANCGTKMHHR